MRGQTLVWCAGLIGHNFPYPPYSHKKKAPDHRGFKAARKPAGTEEDLLQY